MMDAQEAAQKWWNALPAKREHSGLKGYSVSELLVMYSSAHSAQVEAERDAALLELKFAKMQSRTHSDEAWRKKLTEAEAELVKLREALRQIRHDGLNNIHNAWHCRKLAAEALGETVPEEK